MNRHILLLGILFLVLLTPGLHSQGTLSQYTVPMMPRGESTGASIASNLDGDILVMFANSAFGACYYFRKHGSSAWVGPTAVPDQHYPDGVIEFLTWTDVTAAIDGQFHAVWSFHTHYTEDGAYYAVFDPASETWNALEQILENKIEEPRISTNWLTGELFLSYCSWFSRAPNKDVIFKIKGAAGWGPEINLSKDTVTNSMPSPDMGNGSRASVMAPHGDHAETNLEVAVDETDGYYYAAWKEDQRVDVEDILYGDDWELRIHMALIDPSHRIVWHDQVTKETRGFQFMPSVAALYGKATMVYAWMQEGYCFAFLTRSGDILLYDAEAVPDNWLAPLPLIPHYIFTNRTITHGDETAITLNSVDRTKKLLRMKDFEFLDKTAIDLSDHVIGNYPYDAYSDPNIGIMIAWHDNEDIPVIHFNIYNYPRPAVRPAIHLAYTSAIERSFFKKLAVNIVTWENSPANVNRKIKLTGFRIYRKLQNEPNNTFKKVGEVNDNNTFKFYDMDGLSSTSFYTYFVACVDDKGNESRLPGN